MGWGVCTPVEFAASLALSGAPEVLVRDVAGAVEIEAIDGDTVVVTGRACGASAAYVDRAGAAVVVTVGGRPDKLELTVGVPRSLATLRVQQVVGPVSVEGASGQVFADRLVGPLAIEGAGDVTIANQTGPVSVEDARSVTARGVTGPVALEDIGGDALLTGVIGPVSADGVQGRLSNEGGTGPVSRD